MTAYYNEIDPYAADWLRNLIAAGEIAPGDVDTRSIEDICPDDLRPYTQCHFFAGVGLWSYALRRVGWSDDRPIWTGSCPCQPFSAAGKSVGFDDERHLWPAFFHLVTQRRPSVVCGEQVASKDGYAWVDLVQTDLEGLGYAMWPVVLPIAGVGGPNERHRTFWVGLADDDGQRQQRGGLTGIGQAVGLEGNEFTRGGAGGGVADATNGYGRPGECGAQTGVGAHELGGRGFAGGGASHGLGEPERPGLEGYAGHDGGAVGRQEPGRPATAPSVFNGGVADGQGERCGKGDADARGRASGDCAQGGSAGLARGGADIRPGPLNGFWRNADWLYCTDGKWRPVEPGTRPLAYGLPRSMGALGPELERLCRVAGIDSDSLKRAKSYRVGSLKGYGNAISPEPAMAFIDAWKDLAP